MFMYHFVFPYCDRDDHQGRPTTTKYQPQVLRKRSAVMAKKKATRRLRQCDYILIRVLADYNASCHTAKRAEKKEDEDETKRMRVCENMVSAWLNDGGSVAT